MKERKESLLRLVSPHEFGIPLLDPAVIDLIPAYK